MRQLSRMYALCVASIILSITGAWAQTTTQVWNLESCIKHALANNISLQQVQLNVQTNRQNLIQSRADLLPSISASANHSINFGLRFDQASGLLYDQRFMTTSIGINAQYTVFNGLANYYTVVQNAQLYKGSQMDYEQAVDDLTLNIVDLYMQVLFAIERAEVLRQQVDILQQQAERTKILFDAGAIVKGEYLTIQSQLSQQEIQLINAENAVMMTKLSLIQALNIQADDIQIDMPDFSKIKIEDFNPAETPTTIYNQAVGLRPGILAKEWNIKAAQKTLAIARGSYYPQLFISANVSSIFSELRKENPFDPNSATIPFLEQMRRNNGQAVSFGMSIPILNGLQVRTSVQKAKLQLTNAELAKQNEEMKLRNNIQKAYGDAKAAFKTYEANQKNMESLEEAFQYAKDKFEVNAINSIQFNDAATKLFNAKTELLISRYDYIFKTKVLDFYKGRTITFN